jgi:hypothetical protein
MTGGPVIKIAVLRKSCALFIAFFAMSGRYGADRRTAFDAQPGSHNTITPRKRASRR